jgi:hypothetical protein
MLNEMRGAREHSTAQHSTAGGEYSDPPVLISPQKLTVRFYSFVTNNARDNGYGDVWGSGGIAPPFLTFALDVSGQLRPPAALPLREESLYLSDKRLGGPQSRSIHCSEQKNLLPLPGIEPQIMLEKFVCLFTTFDKPSNKLLSIIDLVAQRVHRAVP